MIKKILFTTILLMGHIAMAQTDKSVLCRYDSVFQGVGTGGAETNFIEVTNKSYNPQTRKFDNFDKLVIKRKNSFPRQLSLPITRFYSSRIDGRVEIEANDAQSDATFTMDIFGSSPTGQLIVNGKSYTLFCQRVSLDI